MPSVLVATPGAANANTYCTRAEANTYHDDRPAAGTTWATATDANKDAALLYATKLMDALWEWTGWAVNDVQALCWPRNSMFTRQGYTIDNDVIPNELKHATAEFARQLLAADLTGNSDVEVNAITRIKAGSVELEFDPARLNIKTVPDAVVNLIPPSWGYVRNRNRGTVELARG